MKSVFHFTSAVHPVGRLLFRSTVIGWAVGCCLLAIVSKRSHAADDKPSFPVKWQIDKEIQSPESIYFDEKSGFLFLSQIGGGGGTEKDGDGWISKLSVDGKFVTNKWVTGLNSPKGLRSHGDLLWVTDIDEIISIEISTGKIHERKKVADAKFLNDLACGPDGTVYVADLQLSRIYQYRDGKLDVFLDGPQLQHPNGLLVMGDQLIVAAWGKDLQSDFTTKSPGQLLRVHLSSKKIEPITPTPLGNLDGVESDGKSGFIVTDWLAGKVFHVLADGKASTILSLKQGTADHAILLKQRYLLLPEMMENRLTAYDISPILK